MKNLNLTAFLIIGVALSMGAICWFMHERGFALVLFGLGLFQAALLAYRKWKRR